MNIEKALLAAAIGLTGFIAWKILKGSKPITATGDTAQLKDVELSRQNMNVYGESEPGIWGS